MRYLLDLIGVAVFAISGAQIAESDRHPALVVVLMGAMTGTAGDVLRDAMSAQVPLIFRQDPYATAAIAGITAYLALQWLRVPRSWSIGTSVAVILGLRLVAVLWGARLPRLSATH